VDFCRSGRGNPDGGSDGGIKTYECGTKTEWRGVPGGLGGRVEECLNATSERGEEKSENGTFRRSKKEKGGSKRRAEDDLNLNLEVYALKLQQKASLGTEGEMGRPVYRLENKKIESEG